MVRMHIKKLASSRVVTLPPEGSIVDAARVMREKHVGSVVIVGTDERPVGIVTDRDIVVEVVAQAPAEVSKVELRDLCTNDLLVAIEDEDLETVLARMRRHGVRRMPVVDRAGKLRGLFSLDDALGAIAEELGSVASLLRTERVREDARRGSGAYSGRRSA